MVELAGGMGYRQPNASFTGPGISPWAPDAWSGGSSSGSGSAVGAGLVPFAIGSETWGSILAPATLCGVTGLRPTYGRVSRHGAMALCWTLDKLGPLALTADDCGLVLDAIAGPDPADPSAAARPYRYDAADPGRPFRFAVVRGAVAREIDRALSRFDALVGPSRGAVGARLGAEFRSPIRGGVPDVLGAIGAAAGLPAVGVPCGLTSEGLPVGLQFLGRAWDENVVLAAARAWQAATPYHRQRPPLS